MNRSNADRVREINQLARRMAELCSEITDEHIIRLPKPQVSGGLSTWVRSLLRSRARLNASFDEGLFADPAFELLLDLFASEEEGKLVSVTAACCTAGVPPTTALRWISLLESRGLIERHCDPHDRRRIFLQLTAEASDTIRAWVSATANSGLDPA
jgi:hypothetical protein